MEKRTVSIAEAIELRRERVQATFKLDPTVIITLKGVDYTLEFDNAAVKGVLKDTGYNMMSTAFSVDQMQDPDVMGAMLFRGLQHNHSDMTQEKADSLFSVRLYPYVLEKLRQSLALFLPDMTDVDVEKPKEAAKESEDPTLQQAVAGSATGQRRVV